MAAMAGEEGTSDDEDREPAQKNIKGSEKNKLAFLHPNFTISLIDFYSHPGSPYKTVRVNNFSKLHYHVLWQHIAKNQVFTK